MGRNFAFGDEAREKLVDDILEYCLTNAARLWTESGCGEREMDKFRAMLFKYMRQRAQWRALTANRAGRRNMEYRDQGGEGDEGDYVRPTTFVRPEQEDAVFAKQMIEQCERLPPHDRELARLVFDRASAYEMAKELGVSLKDIAIRTTSLTKKLG